MALNSNTPYGGTTSLPQYLQKRTQGDPNTGPLGSNPQQAKPKTQPSGPTPPPATQRPQNPNTGPLGSNPMPQPPQSPGMVGSQPIPPAPPPPMPAAPAGMQSGGQQVTRTGAQQGAPPPSGPPAPESFGLPDIIRQMLQGGGRYDDDLINRLRTESQRSLEDERRQATDRLTANAASRGLLRSSGLSTSLGDVEERFMRGRESAETDLMSKVADAKQQDLLSAIQAAFGFGQGQLQQEQQQQNWLIALAQLGLLGGPTVPGAAAGFDNLPQPGVPNAGPAWWEYLMSQQARTRPEE